MVLQGQADPDDALIPAVPTTPRTRPGNVWICGEHHVGCGDGRDPALLRSVVGDGAAIDAVFLHPPCNVTINGYANAKSRHREFAMASGAMTDVAFVDFFKDSLGACAAVSRDGAVHFVCMDWRHMGALETAGGEIYDTLLNVCV